ncbi:MAG: FAD-dependent oxidoreductase, partial [bacterium]|nr:FAD-dependent oxidoreductase [bacterium]
MVVPKDVVVVGAGVSGLSTAHYLKCGGLDVALLEKDHHTGGKIRTKQVGPYLAEFGPNSALETTPLLRELCGELGILESFTYSAPAANRRYVLRDRELQTLPVTPMAFIRTQLFSL